MKTLTIIFLLINLAFASTSIYNIKSDEKEIGTLSVQTKTLANNQRKYKTHLKIDVDAFIFSYHLEYKENALFDEKGLLSFKVEESEDGKKRSMSAKRENNKLLFANGKEILLTQIDTTPFDMEEIFPYIHNEDKAFTLKSFDALTGELLDNSYKILESTQHYRVEKQNSKDNEIEFMTLSKAGKLLKVEGSDFEMILRK